LLDIHQPERHIAHTRCTEKSVISYSELLTIDGGSIKLPALTEKFLAKYRGFV
jgi:hypothetical protein